MAVDLDPQASLTLTLGYDPGEVVRSITDVFSEYVSLYDKRLKRGSPEPTVEDVKEWVNFIDAEFDFVPSNPRLRLTTSNLLGLWSAVKGCSIVFWTTWKVTMS